MRLGALSLLNFKNYEQLDIEFNDSVNCLLGNNGEGKTNVLDAIHVLSFCKSYFNAIDSQCIRFDSDFYMVQGTFNHLAEKDVIHCSVKKGRKKAFKRNKADYDKLADHIGRYPVVMITPYDANLVLGGSDLRRKFIDTVIAQFDKAYLTHLMAYNKVLDQRNALLKSTPYGKELNLEVLDIYDNQLVSYGTVIHNKRKDFVNDHFLEAFNRLYKQISGNKETVELIYASSVSAEHYESQLKDALDKDRATQYTNVGIHKDDLHFQIESYPLKKFASQGQQKSFLLALKMAYYHSLKNQIDKKPILLLDDVFDKLDKERVLALMDIVASDEVGQTFITDTNLDRVPEVLSKLGVKHSVYHIKTGGIYEA